MDEVVKGLHIVCEGNDLRDLSGKVDDHTYCACYRCELCGQLIPKTDAPISCDDIVAKAKVKHTKSVEMFDRMFELTNACDKLHETPTHVGTVKFCGFQKVLPARRITNE